jgi:hypothetical protein
MFYTGVAVAFAVVVSFMNNGHTSSAVPKAQASTTAGDPYTGMIWPTAIARWNTGNEADHD